MSMTWTTTGTVMVTLFCWHDQCGVEFAITERLHALVLERGGTLHCPHGHRLGLGESLLDREKKLRERAESNAKWWTERATHAREEQDRIARRLSAQQGATTRLKRRIANGVCPCCNRHFANVERHVSQMHPEFRRDAEKPNA